MPSQGKKKKTKQSIGKGHTEPAERRYLTSVAKKFAKSSQMLAQSSKISGEIPPKPFKLLPTWFYTK